MITASAITTLLNATVLALTPTQRWEAAGRQLDSDFMIEPWFILIGVVAIVILTVSFFMVNYTRKVHERRITNQLFDEYAERRGRVSQGLSETNRFSLCTLL